MIGIYIRIKVDGKWTFRSAPEIPGDHEYWLKSFYDGRQKWQRVGRYDGVKKAKLLLEREQERKEAARKYDLSSISEWPTNPGRYQFPFPWIYTAECSAQMR
jgi:hypothetical protein